MENKEKKPTLLQRILEQENEQMRIAIEQAIDDGAKIIKTSSFFVTIDGIFLQRNGNGWYAVILNFDSEKIAKVFELSKDELKKKWQSKSAPNLKKSAPNLKKSKNL